MKVTFTVRADSAAGKAITVLSLLTSPASAVIVVVPPDNARVMVAVLVWAGTGMLMMVPALIWVSLARGANLAPFAVASMVSPSNVWDPPCIVPRAASSVLFAGFSTHSRLMDSAACVLVVVPVLGDVASAADAVAAAPPNIMLAANSTPAARIMVFFMGVLSYVSMYNNESRFRNTRVGFAA